MQLIQALPSETRNVPDLLSLQPGVLYLPTDTSDSRSGAVNGGRSDQGNVTIDGVDDNDQVNGYAFTGVLRETQDSIEEFRVTTANANADSGRSSGAQVSMITKSGTNKYHGAAYEYYRPPLTAANNWFNKQAEINEGLPNIPTKVLRNIFGASTGGPIVKDKLFFFGNFEASRRRKMLRKSVRSRPKATRQEASSTQTVREPCRLSRPPTLQPSTPGARFATLRIIPMVPAPIPTLWRTSTPCPSRMERLTGDGVNDGSYSFASPNPIRYNTSIARFDFTPNDRHRIFVRGNLQKDTILDSTNSFQDKAQLPPIRQQQRHHRR